MLPLKLTVLFLVLLTATVFAGDAGKETPFSIGAGARAMGMGGGLTSLASDATAIYYNPAGLTNLEYQEVTFLHSLLFENSIYDVASWVYPITEDHGVGVGYMRIGTGEIIRRENFANRGEFEFSQSQFLISYGRNFGSRFSTGVSLKIVNQQLDRDSDFGIGLDFGISSRFYKKINFGLVMHDILQPKLELQTKVEKMPISMSTGLSIKDIMLSESINFTLNADLEKIEDRSIKVHAGTELTLDEIFSVRFGFDKDNVSMGTGLEYGKLRIDYAYKLTDYISDLHHFSLSFQLGPTVEELKRRREKALLPPEPTEEERRFTALMDKANSFFRKFQLDSATIYFEQALEFEPENEEIIGTLASIKEAQQIQLEQGEALERSRKELQQTLNSFMAQAEQLKSRKSYLASLDLLELIFDIDPTNSRAGTMRGEIQIAMREEIALNFEIAQNASDSSRPIEAIEALNRILDLEPVNKQAILKKLQVLAAMGIPEKIRLGIELFNMGRHDEAKIQFRSILDIKPDEQSALIYLDSIKTSGKKVATRKKASTLDDLQKNKKYWDIYLSGLRHMRNNEYKEAIEAWEEVLRVYPDNTNTLNNIEQAKLRLETEG